MRCVRNCVTGVSPVLLLSLAFLPAAPAAGADRELVAVVPPTEGIAPLYVDALQVLDDNPNEIVFTTWNQGAGCGGGIPASAWKLVLDPETGEFASLELKQHLSQIQNTREVLFEASDGTLFAGGGWCGYKPPYVSFDGGESWRPANNGVHPPNSTFEFVEFQGEVYAGTGYEPYHAELYRWLGGSGPDDWELVLDVAPPRSIMFATTVFEDQLFIGTHIYWANGCNTCEGSVPVLRSTDGSEFTPTSGIPSCTSVLQLVTVGDELLAMTGPGQGCPAPDYDIYRWNRTLEEWEFQCPFTLERRGYWYRMIDAHDGVLYADGRAEGDPMPGIYQSADAGLTWEQIAEIDDPSPRCLGIHDGTMYLGTAADGTDNAYIYRLSLGVDCPWDLSGDGIVDFCDVLEMFGQWGPCEGCPADFNGNGWVGIFDLLELIFHWGECE